MSDIDFPVLAAKLIPVSKIHANTYNPNTVAAPEMDLLELSIREDGFTQPLVCYHDKEQDKYILPSVPVTVIDKPFENRIASTIRHNRARGTHGIEKMGNIVQQLVANEWSDERIAKELGMDREEVFRFKQRSGLKSAFSNHEFSKSWIEFEKRYYKGKKET
jgi:ParB-like chromosome segregation protein Spo0J